MGLASFRSSVRTALAFSLLGALAIACGSTDSSEPGQTSDDIKDGVYCGPFWTKFKDLCRNRPKYACASDLGNKVADEVWKSHHLDGVVPTNVLYSGRNTWQQPWVDAPTAVPKMADMIAEARYEADLETFEWDPDVFDKSQSWRWKNDPTMVLVDGIARLQARLQANPNEPRPVKVHIVINGQEGNQPQFGNPGASQAQKKTRALLAQLHNLPEPIDPALVEVHVGAHEFKAWGAMHSKVLVVDGVRAAVMGINAQRFNLFNSAWHDTAYQAEGEIGRAAQADFDDTWQRSKEVLSCNITELDKDPVCELKSNGKLTHVEQVDPPPSSALPPEGTCLPMLAVSRRPYDLLDINPFSTANPQDTAFLTLMHNAKTMVKIESPNLAAPVMVDTILATVRRGVTVRLILSLGFNSWGERTKKAGISAGGSNEDVAKALYTSLAGDKESCGRLQIRWNTKANGTFSWVQEPGASHVKYMTVDGQVAMVGSANQDLVSWHLIQESNWVVDSAEVTAAYDAAVFDVDWERAKDNDVLAWAAWLKEDMPAGKYNVSEDTKKEIRALLYDQSVEWAEAVLAACAQGSPATPPVPKIECTSFKTPGECDVHSEDGNCAWWYCGMTCQARGASQAQTCPCAAHTDINSCAADASCAWFACVNGGSCLASNAPLSLYCPEEYCQGFKTAEQCDQQGAGQCAFWACLAGYQGQSGCHMANVPLNCP